MEDRSRDRYGGLSSRELWFWLSTLDVIGPVSLNRLLGVFGSPSSCLLQEAPNSEIPISKTRVYKTFFFILFII